MSSGRYTNLRRTQRRDAREQRVDAGVPSARHDWRCPLCRRWYSNYRNRGSLHLQHCTKRAERVAREELRRRAQTPLPSPDYFTPCSTPDPTSIPGPSRETPQSPTPEPLTREPSVGEETQRDEQLEDAFRELLDETGDGDHGTMPFFRSWSAC
jgi:hypothetical protein